MKKSGACLLILVLLLSAAASGCLPKGASGEGPAVVRESEKASKQSTDAESLTETESSTEETAPEETEVSADETEESQEEPSVTESAPEAFTSAEDAFRESLRTAEVGDTVVFGRFEQDNDLSNGPEPLSWRVLYIMNDENFGRCALVITEYSIENIQYDENSESASWRESSLRHWLNGEFLYEGVYGGEYYPVVQETYCDNTFKLTGASPDGDLWDYVFCLSADDVRTVLPEPADRIAKNTEFAQAQMKKKMIPSWFYPNTEAEVESCVDGWESLYGDNCSWWWLKDPAGGGVTAQGDIRGSVDRRDLNSVRPAVWIALDY